MADKHAFLPSAKPHGQHVVSGVREEEGGRRFQENHLQHVVGSLVTDVDLASAFFKNKNSQPRSAVRFRVAVRRRLT